MDIRELEDKYYDLAIDIINLEGTSYLQGSKIAIEFAISVLESEDLIRCRASEWGEDIYYKIQELKQYLDDTRK